ncbi:non-reducing end alpha-L-arabinofuranosidase family hydrolase [Kineosporia sp. A_224]|uniref:non-reducing end alpha-L-arabinofuranosidase family hydrolase n=1 Tax=Kineosporia sp. A_224 TaxID=1962180 RepID=UPI000B4B2B38|nr:non-reducing end alpha-L-arabinofuranosidase family hydrolase [Kineosporia sp. A_224]
MDISRDDERRVRQALATHAAADELDLTRVRARLTDSVMAPARTAREAAGDRTPPRARRPLSGPARRPRRFALVTLVGAVAAAVVAVAFAGGPGRPDGVVTISPLPPAQTTTQSPAPSPTGPPSVPATVTSAPAPDPSTTRTGTRAPRATDLLAGLRWSAGGPVAAAAPDDTHRVRGIKDPTAVFHDGRWHVFATATTQDSFGLVYLSFTDWSQAASAKPYYLDRSAIGTGYRAAPQVFYFAPQKLWYLVYQTGNASYSTNPDIADPAGWSAPRDFYPSVPSVISRNLGFWVDMWVICDATTCSLFSSDNNGRVYRSQTPIGRFPGGMSEPVVALRSSPGQFLDAANVYRLDGPGTYLLVAQQFDTAGRSRLTSWTATSLAGTWRPVTGSPFAGTANVNFGSTRWTDWIGQGDVLRRDPDQTLTVDACDLRYVYAAQDPAAGEAEPDGWRLALLTQDRGAC